MKQITQKEFKDLSAYIQGKYGINLTAKKKTLVMSRLDKVLQELDLTSYAEYIKHLKSDETGHAANELIDRITTNHTYFFRENQHFDYFKTNILPELEGKNQDSKDLRIWSAGCSTGDEPYTLSMLMMEHFNLEWHRWDVTVLATDISREVLSYAKKGIYDMESVKEMPKSWVGRYFNTSGESGFRIREDIRRNVVFRRFNLMNPFPFKKNFHVIFCRNVMIYFDTETKQKLIKKFYNALEPGGYLLVGHSESIQASGTGFKYVRPAIYRKD